MNLRKHGEAVLQKGRGPREGGKGWGVNGGEKRIKGRCDTVGLSRTNVTTVPRKHRLIIFCLFNSIYRLGHR